MKKRIKRGVVRDVTAGELAKFCDRIRVGAGVFPCGVLAPDFEMIKEKMRIWSNRGFGSWLTDSVTWWRRDGKKVLTRARFEKAMGLKAKMGKGGKR